MRRALLLVALLLAGCLEDSSPPAQVDLPTTLPIPTTPPLPEGVLYQRDHVFDAASDGRVDTVLLADNVGVAQLSVRISEGSKPVSVSLVSPQGKVVARCAQARCDESIQSPGAGAWTIEYAGVDARNATVVLRLAIPAITTPTLTTPTVPTEAPKPPPTLPPEPPGAKQLLAGAKRSVFAGNETTFQVPSGAAWLRLEVRANESSAGGVLLVDPDGGSPAGCGPPLCAVNVSAPKVGAWTVSFRGALDGETYFTVAAYAGAAPTGPDNLYKHVEPLLPYSNHTDQMHVLAGVQRIVGVIDFFDVQGASASDPPKVILFGPDYRERTSCVARCAIDVASPESGLWMIMVQGNASGGKSYANLSWIGEPAPVTGMPRLYLGSHSYLSLPTRDPFYDGFTVPRGFTRLHTTIVWEGVGSDPASTAVVELRNPDGETLARCSRADGDACAHDVDLAPGASGGPWQVWYLGHDAARGARFEVTGA